MAESLKKLKDLFDLKDADLRTYSPLTLAYIGDGVYELVIRTILVKKANCPVNRLHKKASSLVKRYYDQDTWKENLIFEKDSFELLQDILEDAGELKERTPYTELVNTEFAQNAS